MPERPLLLFPDPEDASRSPLGGGGGKCHLPSYGRQGQRLGPVFDRLQQTFNSRRIEIQQEIGGVDPEQVLVIETIGEVADFARAVKRVEGLEWMGEVDIEEIAPDDDFFDETRPDKELSGRLYLVVTNQRALDELLSLWRQYQADANMKFERGLTKFRDVFNCLKDIRRWSVQDRLLETGVLQAWEEDLEHNGDRLIRFEAELWFRADHQKRLHSQGQVEALMRRAGGTVLGQCILSDIAYHGLLAELPATAIRGIIAHPEMELVKCDSIMFFRPTGQMSSGDRPGDGDVEFASYAQLPSSAGDPIVAILDGLPLANHVLLADRVIVDDPDDWGADYAGLERVHGTAIASLVVCGDLNDGVLPLEAPVYVRPIMKPIPWPTSPRPERMPEDVLAVDLIHGAVRRLFEGDGAQGPVAPSVRIINLSIGDPSRHFLQVMSPLARLLDWLSLKYGVLFVISAGNHSREVHLGIDRQQFDQLQPSEREAAIVEALYRDTRHRRLLSPAESVNALTIGAVHADNSDSLHMGHRFDPYCTLLPSPISAFGGGCRKSIKPDLVYIGGRQLYQTSLASGNHSVIEPAIFRSSPGNKVAIPSRLAGELSATAYCCGTSNSAALISRAAASCYETIKQIFQEYSITNDYQSSLGPLLKAMVVHGASWGDMGERLLTIIRNSPLGTEVTNRADSLYSRRADRERETNRQFGNLLHRWLGYGMPDIDRVLGCTENRVSLLGYGQLADGKAHLFRLPLPPSLGSRLEWRRLTATLGWMTPIVPSTQKYRSASLWFETLNNDLAPSRSDADWQSVRRGTLQHEVFEGDRAVPFSEGDFMGIKVNCRSDAGRFQSPIPYGLVVSLEVSEGVDIAVYEEVRTRIRPAVEIEQASQALGA